MSLSRPGGRGYSLTELLVTLVIVGILAMAGFQAFRPRPTDAVRAVIMDLEGLLMTALSTSRNSTQDIYITSQGDWVPAGNGALLIDARPFATIGANAASSPPSAANLMPGAACRLGSTAECFRSQFSQGVRDHLSAGVDTTGTWYAAALGAAPALNTLTFFNTVTMASFTAAITRSSSISTSG